MLPGLPDEWLDVRWGIMVDHLIYPLNRAPYLDLSDEGVYTPEIVGSPVEKALVKLCAPVMPSKIACVGRNYAAHAAELGNEVPPEPLIFLKAPSSVIGPDDAVVYPGISQRVDHEGELAVVIGRRCRNINIENAAGYIFGYTVANDVTARDLQKIDDQWARAKGFDTFCPVGPWLDTTFDPKNRRLRCLVNDQVRQDSNTELMIYSISRIIEHVSRFMTLEPGDLILTGTPSGIGPVQVGDVMTVEIDGLGSISNPVVREVLE
ncbi:MAG: fumarylacetoacetate hydrolase family protein [Anaerolineales bacterium]|nr:fumarylacetoacetate hydrolase family protein [Anaerolineales bacterium]